MLKKFALLTATLILLTGGLEIGARLWTLTPPYLVVRSSTVGRTYPADFAGHVYVPEAGGEVFLRFNREGFRGPDFERQAGPGTRRVAVLGDSFIAALAAAEERTLVRLLEASLSRWNPAQQWQVMNFGVSGSSTGQELALWREVVADYRPDLVIVAFSVVNDLADNSPRLSRAPRVYFDLDTDGVLRRLPLSAAGGRAANWLNAHSTFYRWQKGAQARARDLWRQRSRQVKPGRWIFAAPPDAAIEREWRLTTRLLETLAREIRAAGARPAFVALPSAEQIYDDRWREMLDTLAEPDAAATFDPAYPGRRLAAIAATSGFPLLDLRPLFRAAAPSASSAVVDEWLFFDARGHFNDRGERLAAGSIFEWLTTTPRVMGPSLEFAPGMTAPGPGVATVGDGDNAASD